MASDAPTPYEDRPAAARVVTAKKAAVDLDRVVRQGAHGAELDG
jgi:hypothetical protein